MPTRKQRGHATQAIAANYLADNGWPNAEPTGAGRQGTDIAGTPGLHWEVKGRRELDLPGYLRQATAGVLKARAAGGFELDSRLPVLLVRPDGFGPATVDSWAFILRFDHAVALLHGAGFGDR